MSFVSSLTIQYIMSIVFTEEGFYPYFYYFYESLSMTLEQYQQHLRQCQHTSLILLPFPSVPCFCCFFWSVITPCFRNNMAKSIIQRTVNIILPICHFMNFGPAPAKRARQQLYLTHLLSLHFIRNPLFRLSVIMTI